MALALSVFTGLVDFDMKLPAVSFLHVFSCENLIVSCEKKFSSPAGPFYTYLHFKK